MVWGRVQNPRRKSAGAFGGIQHPEAPACVAGDRELIGQELVGESGLLNCLAELVAEDVEEEKRGAAAELIAKLPLGEAGGSLPMMAAVPGLVHMVKNLPRNSEAVGSAARALAALAVSPRNEPRIVKGGALMPMLSLLQRSTPGTRAAACCALSALITSNNENLTPLVTGGVVKPATDVVLDDAVPLDGRLAALRILKDAAFSDFYFQHIRSGHHGCDHPQVARFAAAA